MRETDPVRVLKGVGEKTAKTFAGIVKDKGVAVWLVHAETDPTVNILATRMLEDALNEAGAEFHSTVYPAGTYLTPSDHFSWVPFFDNEANVDWLLSQSK